MAWAMDALVFGLSEPSEAMVEKMSGWAAHRLKFENRLPEGHPYKSQRPILDAEDFPYRYVHDDEQWTAWGQTITKAITRVNAGGARQEPHGFERVFYDDFRAKRIEASTASEGDLWVAPGFNTAVGASIPLMHPGKNPNVYEHDAENKKQKLSLIQGANGWRGSAMYTVNDMGQGYTWRGPKIFRIRSMFPRVASKDLAGGLFPAFWSYDPDFLFWRTANRIEVDWIEFDGQNGYWYNGVSTHYHYPHVKNAFVKNNDRYKSYKLYGGELNEKNGKIPGGLYVWDGCYHTWEFIVEEDMTYVNVSIAGADGKEQWVEVCRAHTAPTYLERLNLQIDYALKSNHGVPKTQQDFIIDWVEVLQKTEQLDQYAAPFQQKPSLTGSGQIGSQITCTAHVEGITDLRYYWFIDGYPLGYGSNDTYTIKQADTQGKSIRCMVKAVGARNMPEAWSDPLVIE